MPTCLKVAYGKDDYFVKFSTQTRFNSLKYHFKYSQQATLAHL